MKKVVLLGIFIFVRSFQLPFILAMNNLQADQPGNKDCKKYLAGHSLKVCQHHGKATDWRDIPIPKGR